MFAGAHPEAALLLYEIDPGAHGNVLQLEQPVRLRLQRGARRDLSHQVRRQHVPCRSEEQALQESHFYDLF